MGLSLWIRKFFVSDEEVEFYARIAAALIVSVELQQVDQEGSLERFAEKVFPDEEDEQELFFTRVREYRAGVEREEWDLNLLIKKITILARRHGEWMEKLPAEAVDEFVTPGEPLQQRIYELLNRLRNEAREKRFAAS